MTLPKSQLKSFEVTFDKEFQGVRDGTLSRVMRRAILNRQLPIIATKEPVDNNKTHEVMRAVQNCVIGKLIIKSVTATPDDGIRVSGTLTPFGDGAKLFIDAVKDDTLVASIHNLFGLWGNTDEKFVTVLGLESNLLK